MLQNLWMFYKALFKNPRQVGAAIPSSHYLATAIVKNITQHNDTLIVELGPGTGIITKTILNTGINPKTLVVIEKSNAFARQLQQRFTNITILEADATELGKKLTMINHPVSTIISSLPLLSLPQDTVQQILKQVEDSLILKGRYIQFTYGTKDYWSKYFTQLRKIKTIKIWRNLPPAKIFIYEKYSL